jgi:integrase
MLYVFNSIYKVLEKTYDEREEHEKEIWDLEALGFERLTQGTKLNFMRISQQWLRQAAQKYMRHFLATNEISSCLSLLTTINHFSSFLEDRHPTLHPSFLTREIIEEFMAYLQKLIIGDTSRSRHLYNLRQFLESCVRWGWAPLPERTLIYREDIPAPSKPAPRYLPEEIVDRLLTSLSDPEVPREYERMVRIALHTGMRVGDLLALKKDCLLQDSEGDYWITFYIHKMKKDHSLPIDRDMAKMIREQQEDVTRLFGDKVSILFPNSRGQSRRLHGLSKAINKIVVEHKIRRLDGSPYRFEFHPLRHTCGTRMINSGYAHKVVQDWLGHESPVMTDRYAKLFDKTKKEAFQKYQLSRGPLINIKGKVVSLDSPVDGVEHQVLKDQIKDRRLSLHNGHCTFPIPLGICPKFNACYQCAHFVTEKKFLHIHKNDLREVKLSLAKARENGWQRRVEKLEEDCQNLSRMVTKLEGEGSDGDGDEEA